MSLCMITDIVWLFVETVYVIDVVVHSIDIYSSSFDIGLTDIVDMLIVYQVSFEIRA